MAFASAYQNKPTQKALEFLADELSERRKANDDLSGEALTRSQGACVMLREILEIFRTSSQMSASDTTESEISSKGGKFY